MEIDRISNKRFSSTMVWAVALSLGIVVLAATVARATLNINAALISKPNLAVSLLMQERGQLVTYSTLLEENEVDGTRHYEVNTKNGPYLVIIKQVEGMWAIVKQEKLRESTPPLE